MNIYQKLIEVRKTCEYLKKDNQGYQFKFVSSSQTLGTLRAAMDEHQLLLVPRVTAHDTRDHTTRKGDHEYFTIATMSFTWINAEKPDEQIECAWLGQGLDNGEKGVGKALTYAEKYFLLKFFNIATDKDDPDSKQGNSSASSPNKEEPEGFISEAQGRRLFAIAKKAGTDMDDIFAKFGVKRLGEIKKPAYEKVCEWAEVGRAAEMATDAMSHSDPPF